MRRFILSIALAVVMVWPDISTADVRMPSIFGSRMVLQRDRDVPVWGWADPGEEVAVSIAGQSAVATAGTDGRWRVVLAPMCAGGPFNLTVRAHNTITLENIMIGEVWVCSGQSNMEMRVQHVMNAPDELADAYHPGIRLFQMTNDIAPEPRDDCEGRWEVCRPSTVGVFSAAAYFFGRKLHEELDVPIGLIHASWGGTTVEAWMSPEAAGYSPEFSALVDHWASTVADNPDDIVSFYHRCRDWEEDVHHAEYAGKRFPDTFGEPPARHLNLVRCPQMPSWVYNAMIAPIATYAIRGAIWYQGESNAGRAYEYRRLFPALIADWRRIWEQGDFPFVFVQLANFGKPKTEPAESAWAELREAQLMTLSVPKTAMAVAIDLGAADNIHPLNKQDVGKRLALGALDVAYGRDIVSSGPLYSGMSAGNGSVRLRFTNIGGGLVAQDGDPLAGFTIAGEDRIFVNADARIEGDEVVVRSASVPHPVAVRYGWADNPECTLYNREELPASPFRTDDWPGVTADR